MLLDFIDNIDAFKILGYGLSGFAFLLMLFAFLLLRQVISKEKETNKMIFKSIWAFMALSFVMTIVIGVFSFFVTDYKQGELKDLDNVVKTYQDLKTTNNQLASADSAGVFKNPEAFDEFKEEQTKVINSLDSTVKNSDASPAVKDSVTHVKGQINILSAQLSDRNLTDTKKRDSLKTLYIKSVRRLNTFSVEATKNKTMKARANQ